MVSDFGLLLTRGGAAELHERAVPDPVVPVVWWHEVTTPALVLGSSQDASVVDVDACRRAGVDVVRRRSGGGAVLLIPGEVVWFDVIVPVGLVPEIADVRGSMVWLGRRLLDALDLGAGCRRARRRLGVDRLVEADLLRRHRPRRDPRRPFWRWVR